MKSVLLLLLVPFMAFSQLNGNYTVGSTGSDYSSVAAIFQALTTQGVSGPVVFNFAPGDYAVSQLTLGTIPGASSVNTIIFQAANLNAESVTFSGERLEINGSHCILRYLRFDPPRNSFDGHSILLYGDFLEVRNCHISKGGINIKGNNLVIADNSFDVSLVYCIYRLNWSSATQNLQIVRNHFSEAGTRSIELNKINNVEISNNVFGRAGYGSILINTFTGTATISSNIIKNTQPNNSQDFTKAAIYLQAPEGNNSITLTNNLVDSQNQNLNIVNFKTVKVFHNNFKSAHNCLLIERYANSTAVVSYEVKNNVFCSSGKQDIAVKNTINMGTYTSDYNAFRNDIKTVRYLSGDNRNLEKYYTFEEWKAFSNKEANSFVAGYVFASDNDLHTPNALLLNNRAVVIPGIAIDFDGDPRNSATPDIGADEFEMDYTDYSDIELVSIDSPTLSNCDNTQVTLSVKNNGTSPVTSFGIATAVNNFRGSPVTVTTLINPSETVSVNVPNFIIGKNTFYEKLHFQVVNPNGGNDNNYSNDHKTIVNVLKLGDFDIYVEKDNCGVYKSLTIPNMQTGSVLWSTGAVTQKTAISGPGTYTVTVTNAQNCTFTKSITLN